MRKKWDKLLKVFHGRPKEPWKQPQWPKDRPRLDYWMLSLLRRATMDRLQKLTIKLDEPYVREQIERRNQFNPIGQLQVIADRLNEIQEFDSRTIQEALHKCHQPLQLVCSN